MKGSPSNFLLPLWDFPVHLSLCGGALLPNLMLGCSVVKSADCGGARCKGTP